LLCILKQGVVMYVNSCGTQITPPAVKKEERSSTPFLLDQEEQKRKDEVKEAMKEAQKVGFLSDLKKYGGAAFYMVQNQQKIEELLEKKKAELEEKYGINSEPPLDPKARAEALKNIQDELEEYKKALQEEMKKEKEAEEGHKQNSKLSELLQKK